MSVAVMHALLLPDIGLCPFGWRAVSNGGSICRTLAVCGVLLRQQCEMQGGCATCRVSIRHGSVALTPRSSVENRLLGCASALRLACQCHVRGGAGLVVVEAV
ncbi:putative ferredoxin, 2Fe-2S [Candidatus Tremblaya princeps PCIT]|uniref:Putative ferredoxin, 2Fe-2S n=1 Tax=Tremblaya princeps (strain PCIT) TaxID=891398 RepID=F7XYH0_TREPP|nr:putative ferredoxin, 2Fe-2S [Candidatus Tremblaya princeps PCIT]